MTRSLTAQAVSLALSVLVTASTLLALDGLAGADHTQQQAVAATVTRS